MWADDTQDMLDFADDNLAEGIAATGFGHNFDASVANEIASGLSISEYIMKAPIRERNARIRDMSKSDNELAQFQKVSVDPKTGYPSTEYDFEAAAQYLVDRGDEGFQSTEEMNEAISDSVKQADEYRNLVNQNASGAGMAGDFVGAMVTQAAEPVNYVAVIPGVGQAASLGTKVAVGAAEAAAGAALVAPTIGQWKNENDIEYTKKDMFMDVGLSAVFGGALGGASHWVGGKLKDIRERKANAVDPNEKEALEAAEERLMEFETEANQSHALGGDAPAAEGEYFDRIDDMAKALMRAEDTFEEPPLRSPLDLEEDAEEMAFEESLGVTRAKPETPEGVDVDPDAPDVIEITNKEDFDFEMDGVSAKHIVKGTDSETKRIEDAIMCMMGGKNA